MSDGQQGRPPVWRMVREAIDAFGGKATNSEIRDWILQRYPDTNRGTIACQISVCTVNQPGRVHFPENHRPREATANYDFLFHIGRGQVVRYDPALHGRWRISRQEDGRLSVEEDGERAADEAPVDATAAPMPASGNAFAAETHLRDYLVQHLDAVEPGLQLFVDDIGNDGVEYITSVGRIDILALDAVGGLVVIELKVGRGADAVCGQILGYRSWVKEHLAAGRRVRGIIVAQHCSDRLRYALQDIPDMVVKVYELTVSLHDVAGDPSRATTYSTEQSSE